MPSPPPEGYLTQGNVQWTRAQHESELERAALAARQKKALMDAMAAMAHKPPVATSAAQYLEMNRPPAPPPGEVVPAPAPVRREAYVPAFESAPGRPGPSAPVSGTAELPAKRGGWFGLFKSRDEGPASGPMFSDPVSTGGPPPAAYPEPSTEGMAGPAPAAPATPAPADPESPPADALAEATRGAPAAKPSFFERLFGKEKGPGSEAPDAPPAPLPSAAPTEVGSGAPAPAPGPPASGGIPAPPSFEAPAAPVPPAPGGEAESDEDSSIFVRRQAGAAAGETATIQSTTQATVAGVLVRLYEGTPVVVLGRQGSLVRIRLPDQREGTVAASALEP